MLCNRITISYCVDDNLRLQNPPHKQGTGAEDEEAAWSQEAATGQSEFGVMMPHFFNLFAGKFKTQLLNRFSQIS